MTSTTLECAAIPRPLLFFGGNHGTWVVLVLLLHSCANIASLLLAGSGAFPRDWSGGRPCCGTLPPICLLFLSFFPPPAAAPEIRFDLGGGLGCGGSFLFPPPKWTHCFCTIEKKTPDNETEAAAATATAAAISRKLRVAALLCKFPHYYTILVHYEGRGRRNCWANIFEREAG